MFNLIENYGDKKFKKMEEETVKEINFDNQQIISTGGSVIYCKEGMKHLQNKNNLIIYLDVDFLTLKSRTDNFTNRGIVFDGLTPLQLYHQRKQLYKKYCDMEFKPNLLNTSHFIENLIYFI